MDSFKGSVTSIEAGHAVKRGFGKILGTAAIDVIPAADGGEGTLDALCVSGNIVKETVRVKGPFGKKTDAVIGFTENGTAVIEMCQAAGITLAAREELDPYTATTYGVGEMISYALDRGSREFIVGLGGSCTHDCGTGMLSALGYRFTDGNGKETGPGSRGTGNIKKIDFSGVDKRLSECRFRIICDVDAPLMGATGATYVFSKQKGASDKDLPVLEANTSAFFRTTSEYIPDISDSPGSGAAGGMGFAFRYYLGAAFEKGIVFISEFYGITEKIDKYDLVITGEGRLDDQTSMGKVPYQIAELGHRAGKPVIAIAGSVKEGCEDVLDTFLDAYFPVIRGPVCEKDAMEHDTALRNIEKTASQIARILVL